MNVKKSLKVKMPTLKRCKDEEPGIEDDDSFGNPKKRKANKILINGYGTWGKYCDYLDSEVESNSQKLRKGKRSVEKEEVVRHPLARTSCGRTQVPPSRFNDSVIEPWKKEKSTESVVDNVYDVDVKTDKFSLKCSNRWSNVGKKKEFGQDRFSYKDVVFLGCKRFDSRKFSSLLSSLTSLHGIEIEVEDCLSLGAHDESMKLTDLTGVERLSKENVAKRKEFFRTEDFSLGDVVWARSGKRYPLWPGIVIDPVTKAPDLVLKSCIDGAICVIFFGYSRNGKERDYAWVKHGMIFPLIDYVDKFQGQIQLRKSKPSDYRMAIKEAFLAEHGFEMLMSRENPVSVQLN